MFKKVLANPERLQTLLETLMNLSSVSQIKLIKVIRNFTSLGDLEKAIKNS